MRTHRQQCVQITQATRCTNNNAYTIHKQKLSRNRVLEKARNERSTSRTFVGLIVLDYRRATQSRQRVVRHQSALCEVSCEQNSRNMKIAVVKIYRTVVSP